VELVVTGIEDATTNVIRDVCDRFQGMIKSMAEESIQLRETFHDFSIRH